jgi:O-antigen/teichoic acid export membrane protein
MSARTIAANTATQVVGKLVGGSATLAISLLLARTLGPQGYGDFTKITTFVALFYGFADFGLNAAYIQREHAGDAGRQLTPLVYARTILAVLLTFASLAVLVFLPASDANGYTSYVKFGIILFAPSILLQAMTTTANAVFQKHLSYAHATIAITAGSLVTVAAVFISTLIFLPSALVYATLVSMAVGSAVSVGVSLVYVRRYETMSAFEPSALRKLVIQAVPLGITLVVNILYFRADNLIMTVTRPTADVGIYGFAYKLFEFPLVIPTFFMNALYPLMVQAFEMHDMARMRRYITRSALLLGTSGLALAVGLWIAAPVISLVKNGFADSILPFRILIGGLPIFFLTGLTMWLLVTAKRRWALVSVYAVGMVLNVVANLMTIPRFGYIAASWTTVLSELVILLLSVIALRQSFR